MRGFAGDANRRRQFDVLAVDAFSGDAIPVHLLTREAYRLYWRHLKPDGVLAVHVSNQYLTPGPGGRAGGGGNRQDGEDGELRDRRSQRNGRDAIPIGCWSVRGRDSSIKPEMKSAATKITPIPGLRMWTDDYSNLYRILR